MATMNDCRLIGRIPPESFKNSFEYHEGKDNDPAKAFMSGLICVRREFKPKDEQYYKDDVIPFKAFGRTATYLHDHVNRGDTVVLAGALLKDENWEDQDGNLHYGQLKLNVERATKIYVSNNSSSSEAASDRSTSREREGRPANPLRKKAFI